LAGFYVGLPDLTQPSSFTGLGTGYAETTQGSLLINIGGVRSKRQRTEKSFSDDFVYLVDDTPKTLAER
jgi:hypothetical protein